MYVTVFVLISDQRGGKRATSPGKMLVLRKRQWRRPREEEEVVLYWSQHAQ